MLTIGFSNMPFIRLRKFPLVYGFFNICFSWKTIEFCQMLFSFPIEIIMCFFLINMIHYTIFYLLLIKIITLIDVHMLNQCCISWLNPLLRCLKQFYMLMDFFTFAIIYWGFCIYIQNRIFLNIFLIMSFSGFGIRVIILSFFGRFCKGLVLILL